MGDDKHNLPFKVGQLAESRSFQQGYRGAWFRCKIKEIGSRQGHIRHALEFYDFPDEKKEWTRIYQKPPTHKTKSNEIKRELMVRPPFPPVHRESQMSHSDTISEETVIVDDVWKVGDLVDWFVDGCYWSGTVTQLLSDDEVKIQLPDPPLGEGSSYGGVCCKDLRPSLEWSPKHGWTVPIPKEGENHRRCARLIQPVKHAAEGLPNLAGQVVELEKEDVQATAGSLERHGSFSSRISASSLPPPEISVHSPADDMGKQSLGSPESKEHVQEANMDLDMEDCGIGKTSCSDSVSSSLFRNTSGSMAGTTGKDGYCYGESTKKMRSGGSIPLNTERSDTLEAAILDLEELANKVRWLKGILKSGSPSNAMRPSWKFVEHRATPPPK